MKIAVSVSAQEEVVFNAHFGRAPAFAIVETDTGKQEVITNPAAQLDSGAGIHAAEHLARQGVEAVISGSFGPKAYDVLIAAGLRLYQAQSGTVNDLVDRLLRGELDPVGVSE